MNASLEKAATSLKTKAQAVLAQPRQTNTRRRVEMAAGIERRAQRDLERAELALKLAQADGLPQCLRAIKNVQQIAALEQCLEYGRMKAGNAAGETYPYTRVSDADAARYAQVDRLGEDTKKRVAPLVANFSLTAVLAALIEFKLPPKPADPVKALERKLVGATIPGFFPTAKPLATRMAELGGVRRGLFVLEPSAGSGRLAEAARDAGCEDLLCIEINHALAELLEAKGFTAEQGDFLEVADFAYQTSESRPDVILMNPPFEKGQDIDHVRHAFAQLRPGGVLVAIMSCGPFFRDDAKSRSFRTWLETLIVDHNETLPAGTFDHSDVTQRTNVTAQLIRIRAPR